MARYQDVAFRTAYLISRSAADAEDVTQDAFVKAFAALPRFRAQAPFRPWILRIVTNEAKNRGRSERRRDALALREASTRPRGEATPSPESEVLERERQRMLMEAIGGLRESDRLVIGYRYLLGLSEEEAAAALNCRRGTVKSRLSRALERLREQLPAEMTEEVTDG